VQFHARYPLIGSQSDREFTFSYAILLKTQCEMVHFSSFVYDENLSGKPLHNGKLGIHSVLKGTQVLLVADKQHGVVRVLSSMFDR